MTQAIMPVNVRKVKSHMPCESCNLKRSYYEVELNPPGSARVKHRLCDNCIEAVRQ